MRRLRESLLLVSLLGLGLAAGGATTFAEWAAATQAADNSIATGTVDLENSNGGSTVFTFSNLSPTNQPTTRCVTVSNVGSAKVRVALHGQVSGSLAEHLDIKVTRGPQGLSCTDAVAGAVLFDGELNDFPKTSAAALVDSDEWAAPSSHPFFFQFTVEDNEGAQGSSASVGMTWEARP